MKLDKRACRKVAAKPLSLPAGHGLLVAEQIDHLIKAEIHNLGHTKTLVLYLYPRQQCAQGNRLSRWTVFITRREFITLRRDEGGKTAWLLSMLDRLDCSYRFLSRCAFCTRRDEQMVFCFVGEKDSSVPALNALYRFQRRLWEKRTHQQRVMRDQPIVQRMRAVRALPRGLDAWVRQSVMPAYLFYDRTGRKRVQAYCTSCQQEVWLTDPKNRRTTICPHCGRKAVQKTRASRARWHEDKETVQLIQRVRRTELIIRILKVRYWYAGTDVAHQHLYETARYFVGQQADGTPRTEVYHYAQWHDGATHWQPGEYPRPAFWNSGFDAEDVGAVYLPNLKTALLGTPWQYCPIGQFYRQINEPIQASTFLAACLEHPVIEHLVKVGFTKLAASVAYERAGSPCLDENQHRTHRILQVEKGDLPLLKTLQVDARWLHCYQSYLSKKLRGRQQLLAWQVEQNVRDVPEEILDWVRVPRFLEYIQAQAKLSADGNHTTAGLITLYRDYLSMCREAGHDLKKRSVLFPENCRAAHDEVQQHCRWLHTQKMRENFAQVYLAVNKKICYRRKGLQIVCPAKPEDLVREGKSLHHCVGGYAERVANGQCLILFLRHTEEPEKPFYTIEVRGDRVEQVHGDHNSNPTPEVEQFIAQWKKRVLTPLFKAA